MKSTPVQVRGDPRARGAGPEPAPLDWLDEATVERVRAALEARTVHRDPDSAGRAAPIELVQTHISSVFLTAGHVFKFKRPVRLGFADFSALADRERFCHAEVTLNRRLAEGVYLDVLPLCEAPREEPRAAEGADGAGYALGGGGPVVDWCVVMRRLPAERMLDQRLRGGTLDEAELEALARVLVDFHGRPEAADAALARFGELPVLRENWDENFRQSEPFVGQVLERADFDALREAVEGWLTRNEALLHARAQGGYVRDGHGDLRCEHVYLGGAQEGTKIIDCIEFNDRFRYGDVANDLAFLLMDLVAQGQPGLARALLERYRALSGDADLARLVPFYACYRATVRGKVTAFKLGDRNLAPERREVARERARAFYALALDFARQMAPPVLVLVCGLMGTGKTALAEALAARSGLATYNSDALRKALAAESATRNGQGARVPYGTGIYSAEWNARTYDALFERGAAELRAGRSVILDASFSRRAGRGRAAELARRHGARMVLLECRLDEARTRERLCARERQGGSVSDGREALYGRQRAAFEAVRELPPETHWIVTTEPEPGALARELLPRLELPPPLFGLAR
jgi:hypothetical protein